MKYLFHLGHPAHFHLFKNVILQLQQSNHTVFVLIKKKDILEDLLINSNIPYHNILPGGRKNSKLGISIGLLKQTLRLFIFTLKKRPVLLIGSTFPIAVVGKILGIRSLVFNEDDVDVIQDFAKLCYPLISNIVAPEVCSAGKWEYKKISYKGYHELAYLHPNNFTPDKKIAEKYIRVDEPYFLLRFSDFNAYHDEGKRGISADMCNSIIKILKPRGNVYISSEKVLEKNLEKYRIIINPLDMHHILAFAKIFIGDSQTMAAEAGVLGIPFIRYNDFVGRLSYLDELENKYTLGYGFKTDLESEVYDKINYLLELENIDAEWKTKQKKMLADKIDPNDFYLSIINGQVKKA